MDATIRKPASRSCSRRAMRAWAAGLCALGLGGCAALNGPSGGTTTPDDPAGFGTAAAPYSGRGGPSPASISLRVMQLDGGASVTRGGKSVALHEGDAVSTGESMQVAKGGRLRLAVADEGLLELGSGARLIAYRLPSAALFGARETSLRLESGYLRIVWAEPLGFRSWPLDVSMSRWGAVLKPGEYFFDAGDDHVVACSTTGEVRLMGNPESLPEIPGTCVALEVSKPARVLEADEKKWTKVRSSASLDAIAAAAPASTAAAAPAASSSPAGSSTAPASKATGKATAAARKPVAPPASVNMVVTSTSGTASIRRRNGEVALRKGSTVSAGQPVQVGSRSRVSLSIPERGWVDLGASTRFVVHKLPEVTPQGSQETWMRLERGWVRIAVAGTSSTIPPPELSFSRWAAKLGDGEYFIESNKDGATACAAKGDIRLSGVPETLPQAMTQPCVRLRVSQPPLLMTPSETAWATIRKGTSIDVALAQQPVTPPAPAAVTVPAIAVTPAAPAPPVTAPPPPPPPLRVAMAKMPAAPKGMAINPPPAELPKVPTPAFEAPPPAAPAPPPIAAAPPVTAPPAPASPDVALASPPAETRLPTPAVPDAVVAPPSGPSAAVPPPADAVPAPTQADAAMAAGPDASTVAMAGPSTGNSTAEWLINVDAFADPTRAQQLLDVLKGAGYDAALRTQLVQGVPSYRVVIAGLSTEAQADQVVSELEQRYELTSAWVLRTR